MKKFLNITYLQQRFGRLPVALAVIALLCLLSISAYQVGVWHAHHLKQQVAEQQQQLQRLYQQLDRFEYQRNVLEVELDIEKSSNQGLQSQLSELQEENYNLRENVAFYQKIMAPELQQSGVVIESLALDKNPAERHYHFSLALLQVEQRRQFVEGEIAIQLIGRVDGKEKRYDLLKLANIATSEHNFVMRYFSLYEGDFFLPKGLVPERIEVTATLTKGGDGRLQRTFFWRESLRSESNT
ncbi:hypothetical protein C5610_11690 [Idiomarina sp. OT37-5b]|jgi:Tfp pilus assembly protein PilE|uniref:DUF6776 family protein n=1 Tax=Idiomarina sp. OT37-5b TaxID=2100422 RepID=UPI000CF9675E|nr:DUF6776 family protein [Idiomarina sp. OT37-5b]AVJ56887.1 hypothetical protein C5610_11690 [Idiomarina sp. OT37-5b]